MLTVRKLDKARIGDFYTVIGQCGDGWCNCTAWWVPTWEEFSNNTAEQNRTVRETLFARGEFDGWLLYDREQPVGWCQCGPRDRLAKLVKQFARPADPDVWAVTCFVIAEGHRRRGCARTLLAGVLAELATSDVRTVEAYPRPSGAGFEAGHEWTGPETMYRNAGFVALNSRDAKRLVMVKQL